LTIAGVLALTLIVASPLMGQSRRALVIGNADYKSLPAAPQAAANARALGRSLSSSAFQVSLLINVEADALAREINKFLQALAPGDAAVFYFSGFAVQDAGENYLLPVAYSPTSQDGIEFQSYSVKRLVRYLETKKLSTGIVIIDPAPTNPVIDRKFHEPGLASMDIRAANLVLTFASLPGQAVPAAPGREISRFAEAWVLATGQPGLPLDGALRQIKQQVAQGTAGSQVPAEISTLVNEFAFRPRSAAAMEWDRIAASSDPAAFEAFGLKFPGTPLALDAAKRAEALHWQQLQSSLSAASVQDFLRRYPQNRDALQWIAAHQTRERDSLKSGVLAAITRYASAYESLDLDALQAVRPSLTAAERKRLAQAFRNVKSVKYSLTPTEDPVMTPTAATVKCRLKVEMRASDGASPPAVDQSVTITLRRPGDSWQIESIQ
jgi:hypothetical protein